MGVVCGAPLPPKASAAQAASLRDGADVSALVASPSPLTEKLPGATTGTDATARRMRG
jgi:hypothetical protein